MVNEQLALTTSSLFGGQVIDGGVTSFSVIVKVQEFVFPEPSVAVSMIVCVVPAPVRIVPIAGN